MSDEMKGIKRVDRGDLKNAFQKEYKGWIKDAADRKVDFSSYLNEKSPLPKDSDTRDPDNAVHSLLRQYGFAMKRTKYRQSSAIADLEDAPEVEILVRTDLVNLYNSIIYTPEVLTRSTVTGIAPGTAFRPEINLPARDQEVPGNRVTLGSILAETQNVAGRDIALPKFIPPDEDDVLMEYLTPFQDYPMFDIVLGSETHKMRTVGVGLRWTYAFARNSNLRAEALRRAVRKIGISHQARMINLGLLTAMSTIASDNAADKKAHAVMRYPDNGTAAYSSETQNAIGHILPQTYSVNTIVGGSQAITKWENTATGSPNELLSALASQAPESTRRFTRRNVNVAYPENTIVLSKDITANSSGNATANASTDLDVSAEQVFMFDSRETLGLAIEAGSEINETERIAGKRAFAQYFANSFVFYIADPNGRVKVYLA